MKRRLLCLLLALLLCVGLLPMAALAASEEPAEETVEGGSAEIAAAETAPATQPEEAAEETTDTQSAEENLTAAALDGNDEGTATPTLTPGTEASTDTATTFTVTLEAGVYYLRVASDSQVTSVSFTKAGDPTATPEDDQKMSKDGKEPEGASGNAGGEIAANSAFLIGENDAGSYTAVVTGTGKFTLCNDISDMPSDALVTFECNKTISVSAGKVYYFTSTGDEAYTLSKTGCSVKSIYGTELRDVRMEVSEGTTVYLTFDREGTVLLLDPNTMNELSFGEAVSVKEGEVYKVRMPQGWCVLDCSDGAAVMNPSNMGSIITINGKVYALCDGNGTTITMKVTAGGTVKPRAVTTDDFDPIVLTGTEKTATLSGIGAYCLCASEAGYYQIAIGGNNGGVRAYNGTGSLSSDAVLEAGECLYVFIEQTDGTCTITQGGMDALEAGKTYTVSSDDGVLCYSYTATEDGVYCFCLSGRVSIRSSKLTGTSYEWQGGSMSAGFRFIPINAGETVYFRISTTEREVQFTFDRQENLIGRLELDEVKTGGDSYTGWSFTPDESGVYILTAAGSTGEYGGGQSSHVREADQDGQSVNGTIVIELEAERTYFITTQKPNAKVQVQKLASVTAEKLALGEQKESGDTLAVYTFEVPSTGFYTVTYTNATVSTYEASSGLQKLESNMGGSVEPDSSERSVNVSFVGGKEIYLFARNNGSGELSIKIESVDVDTVTALQFGKNEVVAGLYTFRATQDGMYVIRDAGVTVFAENNGGQKTSTSYQPAFFQLKEGQVAYITVSQQGGPRPPEAGPQTQTVTIENDDVIVDLTCGEETKYGEDTLFRFTAPADGLYMVSLPQYGRVNGADFYGVDLIERVMCVGAGGSFLLRSFICDMKAGESVYVFANVDGDNGNWTILAQEMTGLEALEGIRAAFSGTTAADVRESVQTIGASRLLQAMREDSEKTVAAMASLENDKETLNMDGKLTTTVAPDAGVASVTIVGALLNNLTGAERKVTLTVEADSEKRTLPEELDAESAVYLTMDLDGVASTDDLAVPVCITIAVPADMDAQSVRLVHYGADNKTELLEPINVYEDGGVWYARFAVGGFSPFALAETIAPDDGKTDDSKTDDKTDDGKSDDTKTDDAKTDDAKPDGSAGNDKTDTGSKVPKTGDESNLALWAFVLLAACGGAFVLTRRKREN